MLGFLIGAVCLAGFIAVARRGRCHGRRFGGGGPGHRGRHGRRFILRHLFEELETTPGQEKVIKGAVDEVTEAVHGFKSQLHRSRGTLADVLRSDAVDENVLGELLSHHDDELDAVRKALVGALARVHDALDEGQRKRLADLLESGPRFRGFGPYRSWA